MRFILIISLLAILSANLAKPDYVKVNEFMVNRCTQNMLLNPELVCD